MTEREKEEFVWVYMGINHQTYTVERVYQTRGGKLSYTRNGVPMTHPLGGRAGGHECIVALNLTDVYGTPISMDGSEAVKRKYEELKLKAAEMKAEADKKK